MTDPSELVKTILARTREGKLGWEELSVTGYMTQVAQTRIVVDRSRGDRPVMRITDESGKLLETIESPIYSNSSEELLSELYSSARRQALKVEEALSDLKRNLDKM